MGESELNMLKNNQLIGVATVLTFVCCIQANAGTKYNELEDAAVVQARIWQAGGKAKPIMSSDGKIIFAFGQSMPKLTCSPTRACDVEMQAGEKVKKVILGDKVNWEWQGAESIERGLTIQHVVFQPRDNDVESNVIITTDRRTYHMKLFAPKHEGVYLNRVGFYYPQDLVQDWEEKVWAAEAAQIKEEKHNVMSVAVSPEKMDFDYQIAGNSEFKPVRVFNNGEQVFMEMPDRLRNGANPVLLLLDDKGQVMPVNYRRNVDPDTGKIHYVVDKIFNQAELVIDKEKVIITWTRNKKNSGGTGLFDFLSGGNK